MEAEAKTMAFCYKGSNQTLVKGSFIKRTKDII